MTDLEQPGRAGRERSLGQSVRLRVAGALVALAAGTAALVIVILLVRSALS